MDLDTIRQFYFLQLAMDDPVKRGNCVRPGSKVINTIKWLYEFQTKIAFNQPNAYKGLIPDQLLKYIFYGVPLDFI
jgi:hypothetical protein